MYGKIKRGEIYYADLDPVVGSEQGGVRPILIVQNNIGNRYSPTTVIVPITSRISKKTNLPTHVPISCTGLDCESQALLEQIKTIDKRRLKERIGEIGKPQMENIEKALLISVGMNKSDGSEYVPTDLTTQKQVGSS